MCRGVAPPVQGRQLAMATRSSCRASIGSRTNRTGTRFLRNRPRSSERYAPEAWLLHPLLYLSSDRALCRLFDCNVSIIENALSLLMWLESQGRTSALLQAGISAIWMPPPSQSVSPQGYLPTDLYNLNSQYGSEGELRACVAALHDADMKVWSLSSSDLVCTELKALAVPI